MAAIPLLGWTLLTGVCAIPVFKGTRMLAEWLEERPDGSVVQGSSNALIPAMSSLLAFGALAYGFGFGGIAGIAGGAATGSTTSQYGVPNTPSVDAVVFASTNDSMFWIGTEFNSDAGDSHDSTQVQIDSANGDWSSPAFTDATTSALERDTLPPVSGLALPAFNTGDSLGTRLKIRIRYQGEGGWSAWSDSTTFRMRRTFETTSVTPYVDVDFEPYETIAQMDTTTAVWNINETADQGLAPEPAIIDTTSGYNGRRHSLRYAFARTDSSRSYRITRTLADFAANQTEIWVEIPVRYSTDFDTYCGFSTGSGDPLTFPSPSLACGPGDHKLVFGGTVRGDTYRWEYKVGAGGLAPTASGRAAGINNSQAVATANGWTFNNTRNEGLDSLDYQKCNPPPYGVCNVRAMWRAGEWNVLRMHWKHSVPANTGGNGELEYWFNDYLLYSETGIDNATDTSGGDGPQDYIYTIALGRNQDDGPTVYNDGVAMYLWWGYVKVWTSDPGW